MVSTQELVHTLVERFPDDAEDHGDALEALQKQRLNSCDRLAKLNDSQWQRLEIPMGIETILREAVEAIQRGEAALLAGDADAEPPEPAPVQAAEPQARTRRRREEDDELPLEPFEPSPLPSQDENEGLRRRGASGGLQRQPLLGDSRGVRQGPRQDSGTRKEGSERKGLLSTMDLTPPDDLELLWRQLLDDTLPPDKRAALMQSWEETGNDNDRYMMFLEYSSYLRKPEVTDEEKEERRKQLEPLMKEFGIHGENAEESSWQGAFIWFLFVAIILFMAGIIYYVYVPPDALHDTSAL